MKINLLAPEVFEVEDFVSIKTQKQVLDFAKNADESDWYEKQHADMERNIHEGILSVEFNEDGTIDKVEPGFFVGKRYTKELPLLFKTLDLDLQNFFYNHEEVKPLSLHRHLKGHFHHDHKDYDPTRHDPNFHCKYGVVVYYNDEYDGGEIIYPELGIVHKPKARSMIIHGGNVLHGTKEVTNDVSRYFSTSFVYGSSKNKVTIRDFKNKNK